MNILDQIVAHKRCEVKVRKRAGLRPYPTLKPRSRHGFKAAIQTPGMAIIAEVKKAAPSSGVIRPDFDPVRIARTYAECGAAAISVLTDERFFQGHDDYFRAIRQAVEQPLLRKEFIIDPFQVEESYRLGADALLLIVAVLDRPVLQTLLEQATCLGLDCLVEVHNEPELDEALAVGAPIIGINNRDLTTFDVDLGTSLRLKQRIPPDRVTVSESGIHRAEQVQRLEQAGFDAVLVGESLLRAGDIRAQWQRLQNRAGRTFFE